jgi:excisionase family DNA binding protein
MENNDFLTVEQVAKTLQVHWQTVLNYIKNGRLEALQLGRGYRISQNALDKFIKENSAHREVKKIIKLK